jgi:hypothetical protein
MTLAKRPRRASAEGDLPLGEGVKIGLCESCRHARRVVSAKNQSFWLCRLSERDAQFPKYPKLPVVSCEGYQR